MATYRDIDRTLSSPWLGSDVIRSLTDRCKAFLFLYSITHKTLVSWSENIQEVLGDNEASLAREGNLFLQHAHPEDRFRLLPRLEQALEGESNYRETYRWTRPDTKQLRWLHCRANRVQREGDLFFEGIIIDLSDEIGGGTIVSTGAASPDVILSALPFPIFSVNTDFQVLRINQKRIDCTFGDPLFRKEQLRRGENLLHCFGSVERRAVIEEACCRILKGELTVYRMKVEHGDGAQSVEIYPIREEAATSGLLFIIVDITELHHLQKLLTRSEKEKGLGILAAGVAHNFNNALQSILGHTAFIRSHHEESEKILEAADAIMALVAETSALTRQLFAFEPPSEDVVVPVDLNVAVMSAVNRIHDLFFSGRRVAVAFGSLVKIYGREDALAQGLEGLIRYMRTGTPEQGLLSIKTYQTLLTQDDATGLPAGNYGKLLISNLDGASLCDPGTAPYIDLTNGSGDPTVGPEMNQACAALRKIGGKVFLARSALGNLSLSVFLPSEDSARRRDEASIGHAQRTASPRILLIDDDPMVRTTVQAIMKDLGYGAVTASNREEALAVLHRFVGSLELVFVDAIMPGADGPSIIREFRLLYPQINCIGFSGAGPRVEHDLVEAGAAAVLSKPVTPSILGETIQRFLASKPGTTSAIKAVASS